MKTDFSRAMIALKATVRFISISDEKKQHRMTIGFSPDHLFFAIGAASAGNRRFSHLEEYIDWVLAS